MSNPYTSVSITGYNAGAPPDDTSTGSNNVVQWQKHLDKIGGPIKTAVESINTNITTAFGKIFGNNASTHGADYTVLTSDQGKVLVATAAITFTLPAVASASSNFAVIIFNNSSGNVVLDGNAAETINGAATFTLSAGTSCVLVSTGSLWYAILTGGTLVQSVEGTPYTTYASTSVVIPADDTIPQNTEGTEYVTAAITPRKTTDRLVIIASAAVVATDTTGGRVTMALFQDSTANALALASVRLETLGAPESLGLRHEMQAGTTSSTTFKIRIGAATGQMAYINGTNTARLFGGISAVRLRVEENAA